MKHCTGCDTVKPVADFSKNSHARDGLQFRCKTCQYDYQHGRPQKSFLNWKYQLKRDFNMTPEDYEGLLAEQGETCAICDKTEEENGKRLAVDHCHQTDKIRGILCDNCNLGLGRLGDTEAALVKALNYIKEI